MKKSLILLVILLFVGCEDIKDQPRFNNNSEARHDRSQESLDKILEQATTDGAKTEENNKTVETSGYLIAVEIDLENYKDWEEHVKITEYLQSGIKIGEFSNGTISLKVEEHFDIEELLKKYDVKIVKHIYIKSRPQTQPKEPK